MKSKADEALGDDQSSSYDAPPAYAPSSSKPGRQSLVTSNIGRPNVLENVTSRLSFLRSNSTKATIQSQREVLKDVIANPSEITAQVLAQIQETCIKHRIDVSEIFVKYNNHSILYWTIARAAEMPGAFETMWASRNQPFIGISTETLLESETACLVHDDLERFRLLRIERVERASKTVADSINDVCKIWPSLETNRLIIDIDLASFRLRWCSGAYVSYSFPARHKIWTVMLLTGRADDKVQITENRRTVAICQATVTPFQDAVPKWRAQIALRTIRSSSKSVELRKSGQTRDGQTRYGFWDDLGTAFRDLDIGSDEYMTKGALGIRVMIDW